jgi:tRNA-splicing ligase RtcB
VSRTDPDRPAYQLLGHDTRVPIKGWTREVPVETEALRQLENVARLPIVAHHVAAMPDVHWGKGATVGSVLPCRAAIVPAAVGVDIGCGMTALPTSLTASRLPDSLAPLRAAIERAVPHGRTSAKASHDRGAWGRVPPDILARWRQPDDTGETLESGLAAIVARHPQIAAANSLHHLGTLGTGNHFIELALDEGDRLWVMLHSGSRGVGNRIGSYFIEQAKRRCAADLIPLPDPDLAWLDEGSPLFADYLAAVDWAQRFAHANRAAMLARILTVLKAAFPDCTHGTPVIDCHHNYVAREVHFGEALWVTRKGALRAGRDDLGIVPGSMGARSYIVRGLGNPQSFCSSAHGAGRAMSRGEAKRRFSLADHARATQGVECRRDAAVLDETPGAYKDIERVMAAQRDLVDIVHTLKQVVCVKG